LYFVANAVSGKVTKAHRFISNRSEVIQEKLAWGVILPPHVAFEG
jgi:hypothetical protein